MKILLLVNILVILLLVTGYSQISRDASGKEWRLISELDSTSYWRDIYFVDSLKGWIAESNGKIYASDDGGNTWSPQNSGTTNTLLSIYFMDEKTGFASGYNQTILRTTDGGDTWTTIEVTGDSGLLFSSLGQGVGDCLYFISNFGEIHCSGDSGLTWPESYSFNLYGFSDLNYSNSPVCYAWQLLPGDFYKSTNGGKEWERIPLDIKNWGYLFFLNDTTAWLGVEGLNSGGVLFDSLSIDMTLDGGETWTRQFKTEGRYLHNIVFLDNFEGWLSGYVTHSEEGSPGWWSTDKIYYSPDSGKTWIVQFECDSTDAIGDIFFLNKNNGWAVTHQGKILKYGKSVDVSVEKTGSTFVCGYVLNQNYPNPFNPKTTISYQLPENSNVKLSIFNILGQKVATLVSERQLSGKYKVDWDGSEVGSGVYFYKLETDKGFVQYRKLILLK